MHAWIFRCTFPVLPCWPWRVGLWSIDARDRFNGTMSGAVPGLAHVPLEGRQLRNF